MSTPRCLSWGLALCVGILLFGCDTALDPFAETTGLYYVYGVFEVNHDEHFVRVRNLNNPPLRSGNPDPLDATVTLENLTAGTSTQLIDSTVTFDETRTHNFRVEQVIQPGATYRLTVERSDGRRTEATATMPETTKVALDPAPTDTVPCDQGIVLNFQDEPKGTRIRRSVGVLFSDSLRWVREQVDVQDGFVPWRIVEKTLPRPVLQTIDRPERYCRLLDKKEAHVAYTHFGPDWPADSVLTNPTRSNVKNGLGTLGGVRRDTMRWQLGPPLLLPDQTQ